MFDTLPESKPDAILSLMAAFRADTRSNKIDLGVGVYKDAHGKTPVMRAVKQAEQRLLETQDTKSYVGPTGSPTFCAAMVSQVFGDNAELPRIRCAQTPGGSGALRVLADLLRAARPAACVWVSDPSWPNHVPLLSANGFELKSYPYYDSADNRVDVDGMLEALNHAMEGDIVVLHGCCHNPTGADLSTADWKRIAELCNERSLFPFIDLAYQGFADGLEEDAAAVRFLASQMPEMAVAASCSKNLALYRERVGAAMILAADADSAALAGGKLSSVIRANYSMPPDHGANVSDIIFSDEKLNAVWREELEEMRLRMTRLRNEFADAMRKRSNSDRFDYIATQKGMFSRLPLNENQIDQLRDEHAIYIVGDGRINVAGLPDKGIDALAEAICSVL